MKKVTLDVSGDGPAFAKQFENAGVDHHDPANAYIIAVSALTVSEQLMRAVIALQKASK